MAQRVLKVLKVDSGLWPLRVVDCPSGDDYICRFAAVGSISVEYHFVMYHCTPLCHFVALFPSRGRKGVTRYTSCPQLSF